MRDLRDDKTLEVYILRTVEDNSKGFFIRWLPLLSKITVSLQVHIPLRPYRIINDFKHSPVIIQNPAFEFWS